MALQPNLGAEIPYSRPTTPVVPQKIGWIGLGSLGYLMARNLARARPGSSPILVWNRTTSKSSELAKEVGEDRISVAQSVEQIATECDVIITNLANDTVIKGIYEKMAAVLSKPSRSKIFVETSTTYPTLAGELESLLAATSEATLITCPVFGAPPVADKAGLILVMSGDYRAKKEVAHLLVPAIGRKVYDLGGNLEKAPTFKLIGNSAVLGIIEVLGEVHTLADKAGISASTVHNLIQDVFPSPSIVNYSDRMSKDRFNGDGGFAIDSGIKDASHIRRLTAEHNSPMPVIDIAHQHLLTARAIHSAQKAEGKSSVDVLDWSGLIAGSRVAAGIDGFDSSKHRNVVLED